jgi:hypothetical protein
MKAAIKLTFGAVCRASNQYTWLLSPTTTAGVAIGTHICSSDHCSWYRPHLGGVYHSPLDLHRPHGWTCPLLCYAHSHQIPEVAQSHHHGAGSALIVRSAVWSLARPSPGHQLAIRLEQLHQEQDSSPSWYPLRLYGGVSRQAPSSEAVCSTPIALCAGGPKRRRADTVCAEQHCPGRYPRLHLGQARWS